MAVLIHVLIALSSIAFTTFLFFSPSKGKLQISYALVALTFMSGTYLVVTKPAHILETCIMGLVYLGIVLGGILSARTKLAKQNTIEEI